MERKGGGECVIFFFLSQIIIFTFFHIFWSTTDLGNNYINLFECNKESINPSIDWHANIFQILFFDSCVKRISCVQKIEKTYLILICGMKYTFNGIKENHYLV